MNGIVNRLTCALCIACTILLLTACNRPHSSAATTQPAAEASPKLDIPQPPAIVTSEAERLDFLATHYWDNFDYSNETWIADTTAFESTFYAWTEMLQRIPPQRAANLAGALITKAEAYPRMLLRLASVAEHYFGHPNSPFRNEDFYIPVLKAVIASPSVDEPHKIRPKAQLETALKNRPGTVATDFAYTTANGETHRLHRTASNPCKNSSSPGSKNNHPDYTLLFFYNPDCEDCRHTRQLISTSTVLAPLIASRGLHVIAIYSDEDIDQWRTHLSEMPPTWTVGYDKSQAISLHHLYDLRAIPCLYLLDKQKRVVLKDARIEDVIKLCETL